MYFDLIILMKMFSFIPKIIRCVWWGETTYMGLQLTAGKRVKTYKYTVQIMHNRNWQVIIASTIKVISKQSDNPCIH